MLNTQTITYPFSLEDLQTRIAYSTGGLPEYIGHSRPGAAESAAEWQIKKISYDASGNVTAVNFADGVHDYCKIWNSRATYSY